MRLNHLRQNASTKKWRVSPRDSWRDFFFPVSIVAVVSVVNAVPWEAEGVGMVVVAPCGVVADVVDAVPLSTFET